MKKTEVIMEFLSSPFPPEEVEWRITAKSKDNTKGLVAAYINNRAVMNRLDNVVGFNNWQSKFICNNDGAVCELSIKIDGEWITKSDGASNTDIEAVKGGLSNAMKRAAAQWGIGRYLYKLPGVWVNIKPKGRSYEIAEKPKLPAWALPVKYHTKINDWDDKTEEKIELTEDQSKCINAFKKFSITQSDLENYLHKEAWTFEKDDLSTLRNIYKQILNGKPKEDYFLIREEKQLQSATRLEEKLSEIVEVEND